MAVASSPSCPSRSLRAIRSSAPTTTEPFYGRPIQEERRQTAAHATECPGPALVTVTVARSEGATRKPAGPLKPRDAATLVVVDRGGPQPKVLMGRRHQAHA